MPELLRVKGNVLGSVPEPNIEEAEACFTKSLKLSRQQGARAWELGTAILAGLWPIAANRSKVEHRCSRSSINSWKDKIPQIR